MDNDISITIGEPEDNQGPIKFEHLGFHRVSAPELTDRAKLAMQIYTREITSPEQDGDKSSMQSNAEWAINAAHIFFDQLEKGNE